MVSFAEMNRVEPQEVGLDPERVARVDARMAQGVQDGAVPGVVTVILRNGRVAHQSAHGYLDVERETPLPDDALFRMYSQTKPVVAALTMMLSEDGLLWVDDPITKWLPEFEGRAVITPPDPSQAVRGTGLELGSTEPMRRQIMVRDLLTMTSGLPSMSNMPWMMDPIISQAWSGTGFGPNDLGQADAEKDYHAGVLSIAQLPNARQPGAAWEYAMDFDILTVLLERASGRSIDELLQERVFAPLGVNDPGCGFYCGPEHADRLVTNHHWGPQAELLPVERPEDSEKVRETPGRQMSGNGLYGGALMTPAAYTRFAQMLLNGGELDGRRLLGRKSIELMTTNHLGAEEITLGRGGYGFGFGYAVLKTLAMGAMPGTPGTYGWGGAAGTWFFVDPVEDLAGLFFTHVFGYQFNPAADLEQVFQKGVYEALV